MEIIDSHTHWGPSVTLGVDVTTDELLEQADQSGVARVVIFPFPSQALKEQRINERLLQEAKRINRFIPYYYIPEDLRPIPGQKGFSGGKWHWMRGIQDCSSNYKVLEDPALEGFIDASEEHGLPMLMEEELPFTAAFVERTGSMNIIIPHLGMLGGNPLDFLQAFKERQNVYFDTSLASPDVIMKFVREAGSTRILFGSDVPFGRMKEELGKILSLPIGDGEKELILAQNIKRLIELD